MFLVLKFCVTRERKKKIKVMRKFSGRSRLI